MQTKGVAFIKNAAAAAKSLQSCPTLCDPGDGSPPGSSVHGILQARVLEWCAPSYKDIRMPHIRITGSQNFGNGEQQQCSPTIINS